MNAPGGKAPTCANCSHWDTGEGWYDLEDQDSGMCHLLSSREKGPDRPTVLIVDDIYTSTAVITRRGFGCAGFDPAG